MNFQALEVFCAVLRRQSFSQGAAAVGISQPAASQLVAHLESELGFQLIDRTRRPLRPTPEGAQYFDGCQRLLYEHRTLLDEIRRQHKALVGTVRVASIYSVGLHTLSRYIQAFMTENAGATIRLEYLLPGRVYSAVLDDETDFGVVSYPKSHRHLELLPWLEETMVVVCPPGHPFAGRENVSVRNLDGERMVGFDRELRIRHEIDRTLKGRHVAMDVVSEFDNIETIKQALEISSAISILPRPSVEREVQRGMLFEVSISDCEFRRPVGIIRKRRKKLTPTTEQFIASLRA